VRRLALIVVAILVVAAGIVLVSAATDRPSRTVTATAETTAPADVVWEILTDFERYSEWNPFVTSASGEAREGAEVALRIEPPGQDPSERTAEIVILRPAHKLRWQSRLLAPGIRDREVELVIAVTGPGLIGIAASARDEGVLVPLSDLGGFEEGLRLMLAALVARAEAAQT
jgi:hypothetical protein